MNPSRLQLALNVSDLDEATAFYSRLFGVAPHKRRPGYVNFAIADPPLKLVLLAGADTEEPLNHLGVELAGSEQVSASARRFEAAGLEMRISEQETCCHATQDKVYVDAPDVPLGAWEFYAVTDDDPEDNGERVGSECCGDAVERDGCCV